LKIFSHLVYDWTIVSNVYNSRETSLSIGRK
jgi:hypothetical protein